MSDLEYALAEHVREQALRAAHRSSGLADDVLEERYATRQDLVAFIDETHRLTQDHAVGYYGISAVVFHADDLPEIRRDLQGIVGKDFWHSKDAVKTLDDRPRIAQMSEYIRSRSAMPAIVFDLHAGEISGNEERSMRDVCLNRALRVLDEQGITDVVLDQFPDRERHNVKLDQSVLHELKDTHSVSDRMWMHHARMGDEHALWTADTVAWSVQRHYFGRKAEDSAHVAPLHGTLQEIHAKTGAKRQLSTAMGADLRGRNGQVRRTAPIHALQARVDAARAARPAGQNGPGARSRLDMPKAPPIQGPEGPSRSI